MPLGNVVATALEHALVRMPLAPVHLVMCLFVGPYLLIVVAMGIGERSLHDLLAGIAGLIGLVAWPFRLFTTRAELSVRPFYRRALAAGLLAGSAAALYAAFAPCCPRRSGGLSR